MAKVLYSGAAAVDIRGKINGSVFSKNRSGAIIRVKVTPSNPQTTFQLAARSLLTSLSQAWRALNPGRIAAWNAAAAQFARTNVFGNSIAPTGKNLYVGLNTNLDLAGVAPLTNPPAPAAVEQPIAGAVVMEWDGDKTVAYTGTTAASGVAVYACAPQSPGRRSVKSRMRLLKVVAGNIASPIDIKTEYEARFGTGHDGQYYAIELMGINKSTGQASQRSKADGNFTTA